MGNPKSLVKRLRNRLELIMAKLKTRFGHKPIWQIEEGHVIVPAFVSNGVQYYQLKDYFNTFSLRGLMALQVYEEWNMRIQREHLTEFIEKMEAILNNNKQIKIIEIVRMVNILKERLEFIIPPTEMIYRFASVAFFDKNESPYNYDPEYCKEKIKKWKEAADIDDFFIVTRLRDMMPLPELSESDLATCLEVINMMSNLHLQKIRQRN